MFLATRTCCARPSGSSRPTRSGPPRPRPATPVGEGSCGSTAVTGSPAAVAAPRSRWGCRGLRRRSVRRTGARTASRLGGSDPTLRRREPFPGPAAVLVVGPRLTAHRQQADVGGGEELGDGKQLDVGDVPFCLRCRTSQPVTQCRQRRAELLQHHGHLPPRGARAADVLRNREPREAHLDGQPHRPLPLAGGPRVGLCRPGRLGAVPGESLTLRAFRGELDRLDFPLGTKPAEQPPFIPLAGSLAAGWFLAPIVWPKVRHLVGARLELPTAPPPHSGDS